MRWGRKDSNLPGGRAAELRLQRAGEKQERERDRLFAERGWRPLDEWDLEELLRGTPRREDGSWPTGPRPRWIEPWLAKECMRRYKDEGLRQLLGLVPRALEVMRGILDDPLADLRLRYDAAKFVLEQFAGRPMQRVQAEVTEKATGFLASHVVLESGESAHPVIEGGLADPDDGEKTGE